MKIAIIGGGWVGCHLAKKLRTLHAVTIYEKEKELFTQTSYNNQNRLHFGYHYPRSSKTRKLCTDTFNRFVDEYGQYTVEVAKNYYCVSSRSIIDYGTFLQIYKNFPMYEVVNPILGVEGTVNTAERYIDFRKLKDFFNATLSDIVVCKEINSLADLKNNYDLVINCTNDHLDHNQESFFELTISLVYEKIKNTEFDAITIVDGKFFSIYPYYDGKYTVTDVEHTPLKRFASAKKLRNYVAPMWLIEAKRQKIEYKVKEYFPEFLDHFKYNGYYLATKVKTKDNASDDRYPRIFKQDNVISCYTGKIQGIYVIEDYIFSILDKA